MAKDFFFFFLICFIRKFSGEYIKKCYDILGSNSEKFEMSVNPEKKFIPDTFGLQISVANASLGIDEHTNIYVKASTTSCDDADLIIPNFMRSKTDSVKITVTIFWGPHIVVDEVELILYNTFKRQEHEHIVGKMDNLKISLLLVLDAHPFPLYPWTEKTWTDQINVPSDGSQLCIRFFDHDGDYLFNIDIQSPIPLIVDRYDTISFYSYVDDEIATPVHHKKYLTEIYECSGDKNLERMSLFVDESIKTIDIKFGWKTDSKIYHMKFIKRGKVFYQMSGEEFSRNLIYVRVGIKSFESGFFYKANIAWNQRSTHFLLYNAIEREYRCEGKHSGSYLDVIEYKGKFYVLRSHFEDHVITWSVKLYVRGTPQEIQECLSKAS